MKTKETTDKLSPKTPPGSNESHDVVLLHSRTEDGRGIRALRSRPSRLEMAELRPVKSGQPLTGGEIIKLHPRQEHPALCDVEVQYAADADDSGHSSVHDGPPRVSNGAYRRNWDAIFGKSTAKRRRELN